MQMWKREFVYHYHHYYHYHYHYHYHVEELAEDVQDGYNNGEAAEDVQIQSASTGEFAFVGV